MTEPAAHIEMDHTGSRMHRWTSPVLYLRPRSESSLPQKDLLADNPFVKLRPTPWPRDRQRPHPLAGEFLILP